MFDELDSGDENDSNPKALRLPSGEFDVPLLLADKVFDPKWFNSAGPGPVQETPDRKPFPYALVGIVGTESDPRVYLQGDNRQIIELGVGGTVDGLLLVRIRASDSFQVYLQNETGTHVLRFEGSSATLRKFDPLAPPKYNPVGRSPAEITKLDVLGSGG